MSKDWYPVIDYSQCSDCGVCVDFCPHNVYDKSKSLSPIVVFPEGCIDGCKKCDEQCPNGAIQHVGEPESSGCNCDCAGGCCG